MTQRYRCLGGGGGVQDHITSERDTLQVEMDDTEVQVFGEGWGGVHDHITTERDTLQVEMDDREVRGGLGRRVSRIAPPL